MFGVLCGLFVAGDDSLENTLDFSFFECISKKCISRKGERHVFSVYGFEGQNGNLYGAGKKTGIGYAMAVLPVMKKTGGCIINITSRAGKVPPLFNAAYAIAKAGVIMLTKTMAKEPAEVPSLGAFLAWDASSYMTGQAINVTGGQWMETALPEKKGRQGQKGKDGLMDAVNRKSGRAGMIQVARGDVFRPGRSCAPEGRRPRGRSRVHKQAFRFP